MHTMNRRIPTVLAMVITVLGLICVVVKDSLRNMFLIWSSAAGRRIS